MRLCNHRFSARRGAMMLEAVLVAPIFVTFVFFLIQMTMVWTAKQMTAYAAYCAARAALVYNPADYNYDGQEGKLQKWQTWPNGGVCHEAAVTVLSWMSWSLGKDATALGDQLNFKVGDYYVPRSQMIRRQVLVRIQEFKPILNDGEKIDTEKNNVENKIPIERQFPAVTAEVEFRFPLFIPFGDLIVAYFFAADDVGIDTEGSIGLTGFTAKNGQLVDLAVKTDDKDKTYFFKYRDDVFGYYSIPLRERCTLAKPWKTDPFPVRDNLSIMDALQLL